jgi:hypothetical protein
MRVVIVMGRLRSIGGLNSDAGKGGRGNYINFAKRRTGSDSDHVGFVYRGGAFMRCVF